MGDHTECLEIAYDPARLSFEEILRIFWEAHDPGRPAYSCQYKAILFWHDDEQRAQAEQSRDLVQSRLGRAVTTEVRAAGPFWPAEDYHQKHGVRRHPDLVAALLALDPSDPGLVRSTAAVRLNAYLAGELDFAGLRTLLAESGVRALGKDRLEGIAPLAPAEAAAR
jgi:peptide-methionine (S)-S-oxide reductase